MSNEKREGEHPARAYGVTGGGFAEGQANPEQIEDDKGRGHLWHIGRPVGGIVGWASASREVASRSLIPHW
jgi:hypothetical protein